MNREYSREWYLERISWIKAAKRDISMTSDIIVGFPGETDQDLEDTATFSKKSATIQVFASSTPPAPTHPPSPSPIPFPTRSRSPAFK